MPNKKIKCVVFSLSTVMFNFLKKLLGYPLEWLGYIKERS